MVRQPPPYGSPPNATGSPPGHYNIVRPGADPLGEGSIGKKVRKIRCMVAGDPIVVVLFLPILLNQKAGIFREDPVQSTGERSRTGDKIHRLIGGNAPMTRTSNKVDNVALIQVLIIARAYWA